MKHMRIVCIILTVLVLMVSITAQAAAPLSSFSEQEKNNAVEALQYLKQLLKNPQSLQVNDMYIMSDCAYAYVFDISAMNGLGGYNRETYLIYKPGFNNGSKENWTYMTTYVVPASVSEYNVAYCFLDTDSIILLVNWDADAISWVLGKA